MEIDSSSDTKLMTTAVEASCQKLSIGSHQRMVKCGKPAVMLPTTAMPARCCRSPRYTMVMLRAATEMGPRAPTHCSRLYAHNQLRRYTGDTIVSIYSKPLPLNTSHFMSAKTKSLSLFSVDTPITAIMVLHSTYHLAVAFVIIHCYCKLLLLCHDSRDNSCGRHLHFQDNSMAMTTQMRDALHFQDNNMGNELKWATS